MNIALQPPSGTACHVAADEFRRGMRQLASSVSIIAACLDGQRSGLTATAVSSVCADPPTLLVCVNRSTQTFPAMREAGRFCVNVLTSAHAEVANRFANPALRGEEKFAEGPWRDGKNGAPVLDDAGVSFECETVSLSEVGTHGIFVARVTRISTASGTLPLLHFDGALTTLAERRQPV